MSSHVLKNLYLYIFSSNFLFFLYVIFNYIDFGYLPAPFFYDPQDTFMDYFNTNYWAHHSMYEEWKTIYTPVVFLISRLFTDYSCSNELNQGAVEYRLCAYSSINYLFMLYFLGVAFCAGYVAKISTYKYWTVLFALLLSLPGLFALERGNYIIICFTILSLTLHLRSQTFRNFLYALLVCLKQYLLPILFVTSSGNFVKSVFLRVTMVLIMFFTSGWLISRDYWLLFENMFQYSGFNYDISVIEKIYYVTSFISYAKILDYLQVINLAVAVMLFQVPLIVIFSWTIFKIYSNLSEYNEKLIIFYILVFILVISEAPYGYAILLLYPYIVFMIKEYPDNPMNFMFIVLLTAFDFVLLNVGHVGKVSYLSDELASIYTGVTFMNIFRPAALLYIFLSVSYRIDFYKISKGYRT